jgi:chemotaxis protein CheX
MSLQLLTETEAIKKMVLKAVKDVSSTMLGIQAELVSHKSIQKGDVKESPLGDQNHGIVFGNVGFVGVACGMVYFGMTQESAQKIAAKMLDMTIQEVSEGNALVNDVMGELTNMTAGAFKNQLCDRGYHCRLTIPSIIRGKYFVVEGDDAELREIYSFKINQETVVFELFMKQDTSGDDDEKLL